MANIRIISRLDIKSPNLIKGVHLEGLRVIGDPKHFAHLYYKAGADELIYMDAVASLYGRNQLVDLVRRTVENVFIPVTVGGGIRSVDDVNELLRAGADKVAINSAVVKNPTLISDVAERFGSQCMVLSLEAMKVGDNEWHVFTDNGRELTGINAVDWAREGAMLGAGEILLTSIDRDGTRKGFDIELINAVSSAVSIPVIASGGLGVPDDLRKAVRLGGASAVAVATSFHYKHCTVQGLRQFAVNSGLLVRVV